MTETKVRVVPEKDEGVPIRIELRDEDYGNFRAKWADDENRPNVILVSARHESLRRYLGPGPNFEGQPTALLFPRFCPVVRPFLPRHGAIGQACATIRAALLAFFHNLRRSLRICFRFLAVVLL